MVCPSQLPISAPPSWRVYKAAERPSQWGIGSTEVSFAGKPLAADMLTRPGGKVQTTRVRLDPSLRPRPKLPSPPPQRAHAQPIHRRVLFNAKATLPIPFELHR